MHYQQGTTNKWGFSRFYFCSDRGSGSKICNTGTGHRFLTDGLPFIDSSPLEIINDIPIMHPSLSFHIKIHIIDERFILAAPEVLNLEAGNPDLSVIEVESLIRQKVMQNHMEIHRVG